MSARILEANQTDMAARILREGGLVAFPTDTIYGVAAMADSAFHSARLQAFKGGRAEPFSLHLPDVNAALKFASPLRDLERFAVKQLGPHGVTVIVAHGPDRAGLGLRIVQHETGSAFLQLAKAAVVATSANLHGQPPLNDPGQIAALAGIDAVLSVGELPPRPASSVVRMLRCGLEVLREGAVSVRELAGMFTRELEFVCLGNLNRSAFAGHLLAAMQAFYAARVKAFVPAYRPKSSGVIATPNSRPPAGMHAAAADFHVDLGAHQPTRFDARLAGQRNLIAMGADVWNDVAESGAEVMRWAVHDPMGGPPKGYRATATQVRAQMESLLARTAAVRGGDAPMEAEFAKVFRPGTGDAP